MRNMTVLDTADPYDLDLTSSEVVYPVSFQVPLTSFLLLEMVLGLSSNLTVLFLYCMKQNLISSVSNIITMNLHVVDVLVCVCCVPLTTAVVLLPPDADSAVMSCFHEAGVSFASVATAASVLAITVDRYDISVRPARRVLTAGRATALLGAVWASSLCSFLLPFVEVGFFSDAAAANRTATGSHANQYHTEPGLYYHLLAQIPIFFFTAAVMLATYYKILQALNIRIGTRLHHPAAGKKTKRKNAVSLGAAATGAESTAARPESRAESTEALQSSVGAGGGGGGGGGGGAPLGMRASVSVIMALRRAMRRHRERRERQKRVFRMSLLIISTFLLCWTPITLLNTVILGTGPGDLALRLRLAFLAAAYATTILHPLLYAFTRQKFQKVLRSRMRTRVESVVEAEATPNNPVLHDSWIHARRNRLRPQDAQ